jgi:serine/threonine-protein kinase RsbW
MNKRITIKSNLKNIKDAVAKIIEMLHSLKAAESDIFDIRLCMEESLINAIKYGNKQDERLPVTIDFKHEDNSVVISIEDKGIGFDFKSLPDPTKEENLLKAKGRGVFLIKHLMDDMKFNSKGNRVTMKKYLRRKKSTSKA